MRHHTKDKGDIGLTMVIADLTSKGIQVALPISEHMPFDCIGVSPQNDIARIQVKYLAKRKGCLNVSLRSTWVDKHGTHVSMHDKNEYEIVAVYCPDNNKCYYINRNEIDGSTFVIRIDETKNKQKKLVHLASDYELPLRAIVPVDDFGLR